jgi:hypothetical protein
LLARGINGKLNPEKKKEGVQLHINVGYGFHTPCYDLSFGTLGEGVERLTSAGAIKISNWPALPCLVLLVYASTRLEEARRAACATLGVRAPSWCIRLERMETRERLGYSSLSTVF